jgi:glycylpeptide N-tetradecanoyltransferase
MNYPRHKETALIWDYKFWNTQPVPKLNEIVNIDGQIQPNKDINEIEKNKLQLPDKFEWVNFDLNNDQDCNIISQFLNIHYVQDNNEIRTNYTPELLKWLYGLYKYYAIGVRVVDSKLLVGVICGRIEKIQVNKNILDMVQVNLLCVHYKLRYKRLTPVLIRELTRLANMDGYFKALYNTKTYLPTPILSTTNYYKPINVDVLYDIGIIKLDEKTPLKNVIKAHKLPDKFSTPHFVKADLKHLDQMYDLFNTYMGKYNLHPVFDKEQFKNMFLDNNFIMCYVLENDNNDVVDFISYYKIKSPVLKNDKNDYINVAQLFYYTSVNEPQYSLIKNMLIVARNNNMDVFNAMDIMENSNILKELGFEAGNNVLFYYLYNWKAKPIKNIQCSLLLI